MVGEMKKREVEELEREMGCRWRMFSRRGRWGADGGCFQGEGEVIEGI